MTTRAAIGNNQPRWTMKAYKDFADQDVSKSFVDIQSATADALDAYYKMQAAIKNIQDIIASDLANAVEGTKEAADLNAFAAQALAGVQPSGKVLVNMLSYLMALGY